MATGNEPHRDACKRQHRVIGNYLAIQAWVRGLDCIALVRTDLEAFFGLQRFKSARIEWLQEDLKPWFEYQVPYYKTNSPSSIQSLFLARLDIRPHLPRGSMTTQQRITGMGSGTPPTGLYSSSTMKVPVPSEEEMISQLAVLASGLTVPAKPKPKPKKKAFKKRAVRRKVK